MYVYIHIQCIVNTQHGYFIHKSVSKSLSLSLYTHVHLCICIYTYIYIYIETYTYICMYISIQKFINHIYRCYIYVKMYVYMYTCMGGFPRRQVREAGRSQCARLAAGRLWHLGRLPPARG